ncbi:methyltransferase domain-containing protein [Phenylobacterium sp.]|uniref:methyltransferase domain-containing protein n=1 Tax=Phenylobacterium sp. TaxID=1871053 RepID=UPI0027271603|nr:methyltransferase domain-containing protein [Phenylobacterium sp.]MDO8380995.1 methyltransferase domain-containing protein [Phenylobacterium sp.]
MVHRTAISNAKRFYDAYVARLGDVSIVEIGSQDVNGGIRASLGPNNRYTGVDFVAARGVDVVLEDPYKLPFPDASTDVVVSSSCYEHSEFFWLSFLEVIRILRPGGLFYLNAPSNGPVHGYPVDCWRFYPDSGRALARWAVHQGYDVVLLESYTSEQEEGYFNDFVAVFLKDSTQVEKHPNRILTTFKAMGNGYVYGNADVLNKQQVTEDQRALQALQRYLQNRLKPV